MGKPGGTGRRPALEEAAAELSARPGIVAAASEHPIGHGCLLWIGRRESGTAFVVPHGSWAIFDEPVLPMARVEEADSSTAAGRPTVRLYLRHSELTIAAITEEQLAAPRRAANPQPAGDRSLAAKRSRQ